MQRKFSFYRGPELCDNLSSQRFLNSHNREREENIVGKDGRIGEYKSFFSKQLLAVLK